MHPRKTHTLSSAMTPVPIQVECKGNRDVDCPRGSQPVQAIISSLQQQYTVEMQQLAGDLTAFVRPAQVRYLLTAGERENSRRPVCHFFDIMALLYQITCP